jgi:hypothetical protein
MLRYIFLALTFLSTAGCASPVESYFSTKSEFIERARNGADDQDMLLVLQRELILQLTPPKTAGYSASEINLITLKNELGFNQIDGLIQNKAGSAIFFTDVRFLSEYRNDLGKNIDVAYFMSGALTAKIFSPDVAAEVYSTIYTSDNSSTKTLSFAMLFAQDVGPFPPNALVTYAIKDDRIIVLTESIKYSQIPLCEITWNASKLTEEVKFTKYKKCYSQYLNSKSRSMILSRAKAASATIAKIFSNWKKRTN